MSPKKPVALADDPDRRRPRVSVIVEGYNEAVTGGPIEDTLAALRAQAFPLEEVEVILVGSTAQARHWEAACGGGPHKRLLALGADGAHCYALKNIGADAASGEILAFTDSDVRPQPDWPAAIARGLEQGADVVCGLGLFAEPGGRGPEHPLMQVAASVSWGWVVGPATDRGTIRVSGFASHNVGLRAERFRRHRYRTDVGRVLASAFL